MNPKLVRVASSLGGAIFSFGIGPESILAENMMDWQSMKE
jgi:hypothetical protein